MFRAMVVLVLLAVPCSAEVLVQDGDYWDRLATMEDVQMTGGRVDRLVSLGSSVRIEGGSLGTGEMYGGSLDISGGAIRSSVYSWDAAFAAKFTGRYFRVRDQGYEAQNGWTIQGWLEDGSFMNLFLVHDGPSRLLDLQFEIVPGDPIQGEGDWDGDWDIDQDDLQMVRDGFGEQFDLEDLNLVRNGLGFNASQLDRKLNAVPEPWSFGIALMLFITLYCGVAVKFGKALIHLEKKEGRPWQKPKEN